MGRGSKTKEVDVKKIRPQHSSTSIGNGSQGESESSNDCLFSFTELADISAAAGENIKTSSAVVIVPSATDASRLELYISGKNVGLYENQYAKRILDCIRQGFTYEGTVVGITRTSSGFNISYSLQGYGRQM